MYKLRYVFALLALLLVGIQTSKADTLKKLANSDLYCQNSSFGPQLLQIIGSKRSPVGESSELSARRKDLNTLSKQIKTLNNAINSGQDVANNQAKQSKLKKQKKELTNLIAAINACLDQRPSKVSPTRKPTEKPTSFAPQSPTVRPTSRPTAYPTSRPVQPPSNPPSSSCCKYCNAQPCGDSCISLSYTCHKGPGCAC